MKPEFLNSSRYLHCRSIEGSLSMMPLSDLVQWIESSRRSGTLLATHDELERWFFFQNGNVVFSWSDTEGERLCAALRQATGLTLTRLQQNMEQAEQLGISFIGLLSSQEGITLDHLTNIVSQLTRQSLTHSLNWKAGSFRFNDHLPPVVLSSPLNLSTSQLLLDSAIRLDESGQEEQIPVDPVMNELFDLISKGTIEIPPMPTEMQLLMNRISTPDLSIEEITECISDPLLVSKVLRVCNSSSYGLRTKIGTIREAVVYMGLKALMSIVTVHALSGYSARNTELVQLTLHHSLMVGMVAKQLAKDLGQNHDQAFVCGLLHDLGRIVMLEVLEGYNLPQTTRDLLIEQHHPIIGGLVAKSWNFSDDIQEAVRFHHDPSEAQEHTSLVELIHLANLLARNEPTQAAGELLRQVNFVEQYMPFADHLEQLDQEIEAILTPI